MKPQLLFVYNADSGLFNTATDIAHKILSPETYACQLCALTHGHFSIRKEWVSFLETLAADCEFLHRDEFMQRYPANRNCELPAIFRKTSSALTPLVDAATLRQVDSLDELTHILTTQLAG